MERKLGHHPPPDFPAPLRWLAALSRLLAVIEGIGIAVCLIAVVGLAVYQCVARNVRTDHVLAVGSRELVHYHRHLFLPAAPLWAIGVLRHSVFVLGLLGAGYAAYTAQHIRIDAITRLAQPMGRLWLRILTTMGAIGVVGALTKAAIDFLKAAAMEGDATMSGQIFTSERGTYVIIGGLTLIGFHFVVQLALDAVWIVRRKSPPAEWIAEATHGGEAPDEDVVPAPTPESK